jgi:hypothetical protein
MMYIDACGRKISTVSKYYPLFLDGIIEENHKKIVASRFLRKYSNPKSPDIQQRKAQRYTEGHQLTDYH